MSAIVISAFPCCGKSYFSLYNKDSLDLESSSYSWLNNNGTKIRNPDFPNNYIEKIIESLNDYRFIFVSSHVAVRTALHVYNIPYYLVYPDNTPECYKEWKERCYNRGTKKLWDSLLGECWSSLLRSCKADTAPIRHFVLAPNEFIKDKIELL